MHTKAFRYILACLVPLVLFLLETRRCAAQNLDHAITVAVFGKYDDVAWNSVATGVIIGHLGNELHYVLTVLSRCRKKPSRLWVVREGGSRVSGSDLKNPAPEAAREAWVVSKNPETGLSLLVFHLNDPSLSAVRPSFLSDADLRDSNAAARPEDRLKFHAIYVSQEDTDKVVFTSTADNPIRSYRPLGALLEDEDAQLPASAIGAPVFDSTGRLAGMLNADAWDDSGVGVGGDEPLCERVRKRAFLYPMSHAVDMVAHLTADLASTREIDELRSRLDLVEERLEALSATSEEELRSAFALAASKGNVLGQRRALSALGRIAPRLDSLTIQQIVFAIQNTDVDEFVVRAGAVVLYRNNKDKAEPVIRSVIADTVPAYLVSRPTSADAWMAAISEMRYSWIYETVWSWLTRDDFSQTLKWDMIQGYDALRCHEDVRAFFLDRLIQDGGTLEPSLANDIESILASSGGVSSACVQTGDLS